MAKLWLRIIGITCVFLPFLRTLNAMLTMFMTAADGEQPMSVDPVPLHGLLSVMQIFGVVLLIWSFFVPSSQAIRSQPGRRERSADS